MYFGVFTATEAAAAGALAALLILGLALVMFFPQIAVWLPQTMALNR